MSDEKTPEKAYFDRQYGRLEVNPMGEDCVVNVGTNQTVEIDKLYGPLCALGVRIRLEYKNDVSDWVVERERPKDKKDSACEMEWIEMARWDCQLDFWENENEQ